MYLSVRSVCASRMVSSDSLVSQARDVWIKPPLTIRDMRFFSDLGLWIIALSRGRSSATMIVVGGSGGGGAGSGCGIGSGSVIGTGSGSESGNGPGSVCGGSGGGSAGTSTAASSITVTAFDGGGAGFGFGSKKPNSFRKKLAITGPLRDRRLRIDDVARTERFHEQQMRDRGDA